MRTGNLAWAFLGAVWLLASPLSVQAADPTTAIRLLATPEGGVQPQAMVDDQGTIHLVYLKGDPAAADVYYTHLEPGGDAFATPIRVNSQPGSAIAVGTIRGAQLALGKGGRVHVAWNGSNQARPKNPVRGTPMLYARSNDDRSAFEPQRNLMQHTFDLDGGGTVAADRAGNVLVAWHGRTTGALDGEMGRRMWVARSQDDGQTFSREQPAFASETGACGCCGTRAMADQQGTVYMLYRAATAGVNRDMFLLTSRDRGRTFAGAPVDPWRSNMCPMSSESLAQGPSGVLAAWETMGQVHFARVDSRTLTTSAPITPAGPGGGRKHPAVAANARGETLLVWTEGTGWQKGGSLAWQLFDPAGMPEGAPGRRENGVPVWGLPAVVAARDGGFVVIH